MPRKYLMLCCTFISIFLVSCVNMGPLTSSVSNIVVGEFDPYQYQIEQESPLKDGTTLHYTHPLNNPDFEFPFIGDVHPFYDQNQKVWYMYYLDTSGMFHTKLLNSSDGLQWRVNDDFWIHSGFANYAVLNVFERNNVYYSYYADYNLSKSENLLDWEYAGGEYQIPHDFKQFPGGLRDPSVVYDEETSRFYSIGLSYTKRIPSESIYLSNLAINRSEIDDLSKWITTPKKVLKNDQMNKDFECPQLIKIGNRWYVIASQYGNSIHGVGKTSYLIGDEHKNPYEVDWQSKEEHFLTTEDLCAAQIAKAQDKFYIFGWIPRYYNRGFWGGYINLPTEVYPLQDGTLATRLSKEIEGKIRGGSYYNLEKGVTISKNDVVNTKINKRFDIQLQFSLESGVIEIKGKTNKFRVVITNNISTKIEVFVDNYLCFSFDLRYGDLEGQNDLRIIGEGKNLELFLNDRYAMTARVDTSFVDDDTLTISSLENTAYISKLLISRLKFLEEI